MQSIYIIKNEKLDNFTKKLQQFYYSNWYFLLLFLVTFLFWIFDLSIYSIAILFFISVISLLTNKDILPSLPVFALIVITVSKTTFLLKKTNILTCTICIILYIFAVFFNIFHFKQQFRIGKLSYSLLLVSISLLLGGIFSKYLESYTNGLTFSLSLGVLMLFLYTYMISCINTPKKIDFSRYFAKILLLFTVLACLQIITAHSKINGEFESHIRAILDVGWANRSGLSDLIVLTMPASFYLAETAKKYNFTYFLLANGIYICLFASFSRGAMLFGTIEFLVIVLYLYIKSCHKKAFILSRFIWIIILIITICLNLELVQILVDKFTEIGVQSSGRTALYSEAINLFLENIAFGVGLGYTGNNFVVENNCIYWFHSTPLQVMASLGLFGVMCYLMYYIKKFGILLKNNSLFARCILCAVLFFELHCLLEPFTFQPLPQTFIAILCVAFVENNLNKDNFCNKKR